jgi:hypothetical protein
MTNALQISDSFSLPLEFVTQTQAILAIKRVGKSYTASVQAEELLKAGQQIVAIDVTGAWWGLRSNAQGNGAGFPILIAGGDHGDIPLEENAGEVLAEAIVSERFSAILDLSLFRKGAAQRFLAVFFETLYRKNRNAMHLFADEADFYAPQKPFGEEARTLGAMNDIVRRGGIRGIGCTLITQRPAVLNKDVLTQCSILTCLRMSHPKDMAAIKEWVDVHSSRELASLMMQSLPSLPIGTAWVWAPGWPTEGGIFERISIRRRETFNSGATPKAGQAVQAPKVLAEVDIAKLGEQIAATAQRVKENDPKELKRRIAELESQVSSLESELECAGSPDEPNFPPVTERVDREALKREVQDEVSRLVQEKVVPWVVRALNGTKERAIAQLQDVISGFEATRATTADAELDLSTLFAYAMPDIERAITTETAAPNTLLGIPVRLDPDCPRDEVRLQTSTGGVSVRTAPLGNGKVKLNSGARRMLAAIAQWYPKGITEGQVAAQASIKRTGGTFGTYKSHLVTGGFVEIRDGLWYATRAGCDLVGRDNLRAPRTTAEVVQLWESKLNGGARRMLHALIRHRGKPITRQQLAAESDISESGGTFGTYLSHLRTADLIVQQGGMIAANRETLFL